MTAVESIANAHAEYKRRIHEARADRDARVHQADEELRTTVEAARGWFIGQVDGLLGEDIVMEVQPPAVNEEAPSVHTEPPPLNEGVLVIVPEVPHVKAPEPALHRDAVKAELLAMETELLHRADGQREIDDARMSSGMDVEIPTTSSRVRLPTLLAYRSELRRRIALLAEAATAPPPEPEPSPRGELGIAYPTPKNAPIDLGGLF